MNFVKVTHTSRYNFQRFINPYWPDIKKKLCRIQAQYLRLSEINPFYVWFQGSCDVLYDCHMYFLTLYVGTTLLSSRHKLVIALRGSTQSDTKHMLTWDIFKNKSVIQKVKIHACICFPYYLVLNNLLDGKRLTLSAFEIWDKKWIIYRESPHRHLAMCSLCGCEILKK